MSRLITKGESKGWKQVSSSFLFFGHKLKIQLQENPKYNQPRCRLSGNRELSKYHHDVVSLGKSRLEPTEHDPYCRLESSRIWTLP